MTKKRMRSGLFVRNMYVTRVSYKSDENYSEIPLKRTHQRQLKPMFKPMFKPILSIFFLAFFYKINKLKTHQHKSIEIDYDSSWNSAHLNWRTTLEDSSLIWRMKGCREEEEELVVVEACG